MSTKFFTNQGNNSLLKKFEGVFKHIDSIRHFDALVGYFRASGYFKVREFLNDIPKIRILVGINVEKLTKEYHDKGQYYIDNPEETKESFLDSMVQDVAQADYDEPTEKGIVQFIDDLINGKIELRAHPKQKIHAKIYIFRPTNFNEHVSGEVITGSSNLTDSGLGALPESNYEFNVLLRDYDDVKFATDEFEKLWNESVPILRAEAEGIRKRSHLRDDFTPFEIYMKMLMEYFGNRVEYDPYRIEQLLPDKFMRLKYQADAANDGYAIMMKHNGFILADVVGLGKTVIACMIIKKFIYENGTHTRVLVVTPPAIKEAWVRTCEEFRITIHFQFVTTGSLKNVIDGKDKWKAENFDLVVVDESHKFRNHDTGMYLDLEQICKQPRIRPAENGDTKKKVILISATPLNNRPQDIENQLYLFQDRRSSSLDNVRNLQDYFKSINQQYKKLSSEKDLNIPALRRLFGKLRDDVIEPLVIRRTRTDIERNKEYQEDLKAQQIKFPKVGDPTPVYYQLNDDLSRLFFETVSLITGLDENGNEVVGLGYYRYRAIEYLLKEEDRKIYGNVGSISNRLAAIMKTLLVKRLESSFHAFKLSLNRLNKAIDNMIQMYEDNRIFIAPDLDINKLLEEGYSYEQIENKINEKNKNEGNNRKFAASAFDSKFYKFLLEDKAKIEDLNKRWSKVIVDPKLVEFTHQLEKEFFKPKKNASGKLVIFSESRETAEELSKSLLDKYKVLTVSADNRKQVENTIRENFDANLEEEKWKHDYNVIITTEVLAEGINLHRSNVIINYDVPWNSTKLMQRIGRVNRIGSRADVIGVYNFYPSAHGDKQINLVNTALRKLQAFHTAFGEDNRIFSVLEQMEEQGENGKSGLFGHKIQHEESETLKYLEELRDFKKKNKELYRKIEKIPAKARCGRTTKPDQSLLFLTSDGLEVDYPLTKTSLAYLKSDNHPGVFCLITPDLRCEEVNFLQAVKTYKATMNEKPVNVHDLHYQQALKALEFFKSEKNQESIQPISKRNLSPAENKSISKLTAIIKHAHTEQKKNALNRVLDLVRKGAFASKGLPSAINSFFASNEKLLTADIPKFIDQLFIEVLDKYDLSSRLEEGQQPILPKGVINPRIVLTQSFT